MTTRPATKSLADWVKRRASLLGLSWPDGVADACGLAPRVFRSIGIFPGLRGVSRSTRCYLARSLKVSVRELESLAAGRIDWISDDRIVDHDRLATSASKSSSSVHPVAERCSPHMGVPILGTIPAGGIVRQLADASADDTPRLACRYPGFPDSFALRLLADFPSACAGTCLVFTAIPPGELIDGETALITSAVETEFRLTSRLEMENLALHGIQTKRLVRILPMADALRVAIVIGQAELQGRCSGKYSG